MYSKKEIKYQESNIQKVFFNKPTGNQSKFTYNPYKKWKKESGIVKKGHIVHSSSNVPTLHG